MHIFLNSFFPLSFLQELRREKKKRGEREMKEKGGGEAVLTVIRQPQKRGGRTGNRLFGTFGRTLTCHKCQQLHTQ